MEKSTPRIGVFTWDPGGRLSRAVGLEALLAKVTKAKNVTCCETFSDLWPAAALDTIKLAIASGKIDRILWIGRFSPQQKLSLTQTFEPEALNPYLHEWCNLEEQGVTDERTDLKIRTRKAETLIQMSLARVRLLQPLSPLEMPASDAVLIIGAGVSGLYSAASFVERGKRVHVVEQKSGVGGKVALLSRFYPRMCDPHCGLGHVLQSLTGAERVEFHTLSKLTALSGSPGHFEATIEKAPRYVNEKRCNACGACMAVCPVNLPAISEWVQDVPPLSAATGIGKLLPSKKKAIHPAAPLAYPTAFVIEREHCPPDCRACAAACPAQAVELDQTRSETSLHIGAVLITTGWDPYPLARVEEYGYGRHAQVIGNLEMEQLIGLEGLQPACESGIALQELAAVGFIQCVGSRDKRHLSYCSSVCCSATLKQVLALKQKAPKVRCYVFYQDIRSPGFDEDLYQRVKALEDVVFIRGVPAISEIAKNASTLQVVTEDTLSGKAVEINLDLLVLAGGMVPSEGSQEMARVLRLPQNPHRFFESHHQCHPEESQRTGIYTGGCCKEPMNVAQSIASAHLAAMKALNFLEGVVPIAPTYPEVNKTKCDQCKRCVEDCPFSSFLYDEKQFPYPDLTRCRQCGNCMGVCPVSAISLRNHTIRQAAAQIEALNTAFMGSGEPVVLAFLCENDAYPAALAAADQGLPVPLNVIFMKVRCAGAVNNSLMADALSLGIDGVLIAGCANGHCHYIRGNQLVRKRSSDLSDKLGQMMIEPARVRFESLEIRDSMRYVRLLDDYVKTLKAMGPNPLKV